MDHLAQEVARVAEQAVALWAARPGSAPGTLDYSEASLGAVEDMLAELAGYADDMTPDQHDRVASDFGCYVLEVGRRAFGGRYLWHDGRNQPVLVVGEPACRVAILAWDKCRGRLLGDEADNIPFFFAGFAERARRLEPGTDVLVV